MKRCCICLASKETSEFYKNRSMLDGLGKRCKTCVRSFERESVRVATNRYLRSERGAKKRRDYLDAGGNNRATAHYRATNSIKRKAASAINNALVRGQIVRPSACVVCSSNEKLNAHHDDYSKPMDVRWLCVPCHKAWHREHGEAANARVGL